MKKKKSEPKKPLFNEKEGEVLVGYARQIIAERVGKKNLDKDLSVDLKDKKFDQKRSTFVTIYRNGELRGCIGTLKPSVSMREDIKYNAVSAAFHDHRFPPLTPEEYDDIHIEVSVLTEPVALKYEDGADLLTKLNPKKDGVIINKGAARATFLPQVWDQLPEPEEFITHLCMKAGLPGDAWMTMKIDVSTYHAQYFIEKNDTADK